MSGLTQRRERRRAKRTILSPSPKHETAALSNISSSISGRSFSSRRHSPVTQKRKRKSSPSSLKKTKARASEVSIKPKPESPEKNSAVSIDADKENGLSEGRQRKRKKGRSKLAPGLALMQNFQATNIARGRITVRTSPFTLTFLHTAFMVIFSSRLLQRLVSLTKV